MPKSNKGFSAVEALLVFAIALIVGFVGWYVYKSSTTASEPISDITYAKYYDKGSTEPDNSGKTKTYVNKTIGFKFSYPKSWGNFNLGDDDKGYRYGDFTNQSNHAIQLHKKTLPHADGDGPTLNLIGYSEVNGKFTLKHTENRKTLLSTADILASSTKSGKSFVLYRGAGLGYFVLGLGKLENNKNYDSVIFDYSLEREDRNYMADDQPVKELKALLESFQNL